MFFQFLEAACILGSGLPPRITLTPFPWSRFLLLTPVLRLPFYQDPYDHTAHGRNPRYSPHLKILHFILSAKSL